MIVYVDSLNGSDTKPGTSWALAFATIERGLAELVGQPGLIDVAPGTYVAPASGYAVSAGQCLRSPGSGATRIDGSYVTAVGAAILSVVGGRSRVQGFWIFNVKNATTALRVTDSQSGSTEGVIVEDVLVDQANASGAIAFGIGDNTAGDVSEISLRNCISGGNATTTHMKIGNAQTGNVCDVMNIGGNSQCNKYGLDIAGGALISTGLNFQLSYGADIRCYQNAVGVIRISGGRSESALRFLDHRNIGSQGYNGLVIQDYVVLDLINTDGQAILTQGGALSLKNVSIFGATCPQYLACQLPGVIADRDVSGRIEIDGLTSDHPYPIGGSPYARAGRVIEARSVRFVGDVQFQQRATRIGERAVRRQLVKTVGAPVALDSRYATEFVIGLEHDAGAVTINPGAVGQVVVITFSQNGIGGAAYAWPASCAFESAPTNALAPFARQRCAFEWNGSYWEQYGAVVTTVPPSLPFAPVADTFATGNPYWLSAPSSPNGHQWEHVPGGGSIGVANGAAQCVSVGWLGDNDIDLLPNGAGILKPFGAAAVIDCGGDGLATISATLAIYNAEGVIAHYRDDQTFWVFRIGFNANGTTYGQAYGYSHGVIAVQGYRNFNLPAGITPGSTHAISVQCTASGFVVKVDSAVTTLVVSDIAKWLPLTKHGIVASDTRATFSAFAAL